MKTLKGFTYYESLILEGIDLSDVDGYDDTNKDQYYRVQSAFKIFLDEKGQSIKIKGERESLKDWFQGLTSTVNLPFDDAEILKGAENANFNLMTEYAESIFLQMYWSNLTSAFYTLKDNL
jgi:hypothetical protein